MNNSPATYIVGALAVVATIAYIIVAWHLALMWATLVTDQESVPMLSVYTIKPLPLSPEFAMLHWQLPALASLLTNLYWGHGRANKHASGDAYALPLCCHMSWLMLSVFLHVAGLLASFVVVAYQL